MIRTAAESIGLVERDRSVPSGPSSSSSAGGSSGSSGDSPNVTLSVPLEDAQEAVEAFEALRRGAISSGEFCSFLSVSHVFYRLGK